MISLCGGAQTRTVDFYILLLLKNLGYTFVSQYLSMAAVYIPWAQRPGWEDLKPIAQKDCENPLVPIAYSEQCKSFCGASFVLSWEGAVAELVDGGKDMHEEQSRNWRWTSVGEQRTTTTKDA